MNIIQKILGLALLVFFSANCQATGPVFNIDRKFVDDILLWRMVFNLGNSQISEQIECIQVHLNQKDTALFSTQILTLFGQTNEEIVDQSNMLRIMENWKKNNKKTGKAWGCIINSIKNGNDGTFIAEKQRHNKSKSHQKFRQHFLRKQSLKNYKLKPNTEKVFKQAVQKLQENIVISRDGMTCMVNNFVSNLQKLETKKNFGLIMQISILFSSPGIELPGNENLQFQNWLIYDLICDEVYYDFWVNVFQDGLKCTHQQFDMSKYPCDQDN